MSKLRYKTRKEFPQISRGLSLLVNSWRTEEHCQITTSRRRALSTLCSVLEEEC